MKNLIRKSYENELMTLIRENGGECNDAAEIWENLPFLAKQMPRYDEISLYLPLQIKKMLAYIVDPDYRIEYAVEKTETACTVEAFFYWSDKETAAGRGFVKRYLNQIFPNNSLSAEERESIFEATVRGQALSRAITDAGIGLQLAGDCFDLSPDIQESEEAAAKDEKKTAAQMPQIPPQKKVVASPIKDVASSAVEAATDGETVATEKTVSENVPKEPSPTVDLTEAYKAVADVGTFKGYLLGDIYKTNPLNIAWLANNQASKVSDAARLIALSDAHLATRLK